MMNRLNGTFGTARFNQGHEWQNDHNTILTIVINISMTCDFFRPDGKSPINQYAY